MFACANWFIIVFIQNIALVNWESFLFSSILTREKLRGICQYTHCDSQMIISQHCKCGWATACFGDSSRRISLETWLKAISYAFASPTISFPHLCFYVFKCCFEKVSNLVSLILKCPRNSVVWLTLQIKRPHSWQ